MLSSLSYPLLLAALAAQGSAPPAPSRDLAITGARIELGDGRVIPSGTVVVRGGRISAVGDSVQVPAGLTVIDAKGGTLYPGFIDAYTTDGLKFPEAPSGGSAPDSRNSAPPTMWHANKRGVRSDIVAAKCLDLKSRLADNYAQGITTALLAPGSGTVRGVASVVDYVDAGVVLQPNAGAEFSFRGGGGAGGASTGTGYPGTLFGIVALLRQNIADAQTYAQTTNPTKDVGYENLRPLVLKQMPAIFAVDTSREIARAARVADEFGLKTIVAGGREAYRDPLLLKGKGIAVIASADAGTEPSVKPGDEVGATPVEVLQERHDLWKERSANVQKLNDAGIPFALSTLGTSRENFLKNVRKLIKNGLPREAALKALTSGAATILGVGGQTGSIEPGKMANFVLMSGDFADDKSEVLRVVVEGAPVEVKK